MVADLLELHQDVKQLHFVADISMLVDHFNVTGKNLLVELLLYFRHPHIKIDFLLRLEQRLHVRLQSSQHKGAQQAVDLLHNLCLLLASVVPCGRIYLKEVLEIFGRVEEPWH